MKKLFLFVFLIPFFGLNAQTLSSIDADEADQGEELTVTITGADTHFTQATGTTVRLVRGSTTHYGSYINPIISQEMEVDFNFPPNAEIGVYDLVVYNNMDGTMYLNSAFEVIEAVSIKNNSYSHNISYLSQSKILNLKIDKKYGNSYNLKIYNIKGVCVLNRTQLNSNFNYNINLSNLNKGFYIANISFKNKMISYKFTN